MGGSVSGQFSLIEQCVVDDEGRADSQTATGEIELSTRSDGREECWEKDEAAFCYSRSVSHCLTYILRVLSV